jgi:peptidoglycan/xylan/chitin deacetylase (PgdA/CDA1 family)
MLVRAKPFSVPASLAVISFTFDDVFASAVDCGARSLERHGCRGTYYVSGRLMGRSHSGVPYFDRQHLLHLTAAGHEIGCHTYEHEDVAGLNLAELQAQWDANLHFVQDHAGLERFESFSYPFGSHNLRANRAVTARFRTGRDIRHGINGSSTDLSKLRAVSLDPSEGATDRALDAIDEVRSTGGWLIFMTHDISNSPLQYGCTPSQFARIAEAAAESQIPVLPVTRAIQVLCASVQATPSREALG